MNSRATGLTRTVPWHWQRLGKEGNLKEPAQRRRGARNAGFVMRHIEVSLPTALQWGQVNVPPAS
jgi:hypothetical protein